MQILTNQCVLWCASTWNRDWFDSWTNFQSDHLESKVFSVPEQLKNTFQKQNALRKGIWKLLENTIRFSALINWRLHCWIFQQNSVLVLLFQDTPIPMTSKGFGRTVPKATRAPSAPCCYGLSPYTLSSVGNTHSSLRPPLSSFYDKMQNLILLSTIDPSRYILPRGRPRPCICSWNGKVTARFDCRLGLPVKSTLIT